MVFLTSARKSAVSKGKLIAIVAAVLLLLLVVLVNRPKSPSGGVFGGGKATPAGLEKDLPIEGRIPNH
tara:strand:+ start:731 stop:934 length:204 start_codon:yes stop_codon:yes gene_type:complete